MLSKEEIQKLRKDPKNYKCKGMFYACKDDPYIILPKCIPWMGWTINMAHPKAIPMLLFIIFVTTVPLIVVIFTIQTVWAYVLAFTAEIVLLCWWMNKEATKYEH